MYVDTKLNAIIFANRSLISLKLENNAQALEDANNAIEWDCNYIKGYYRRACAMLCLCKLKEALKDFEKLKKCCPEDSGLHLRIQEAKNQLAQIRKRKCQQMVMDVIQRKHKLQKNTCSNGNNSSNSNNNSLSSSMSSMSKQGLCVNSSNSNENVNTFLDRYTGSLDDYYNTKCNCLYDLTIIKHEFDKAKLIHHHYNNNTNNNDSSSSHIQQQHPTLNNDLSNLTFNLLINTIISNMKRNIFLPKTSFINILYNVISFYYTQPSLISITVPSSHKITIVGDLHGQFYDLLNIFELNGYPSETNPYIFNGDFVDRGSFSVEILITLLCFKLLYPNHIHLARGNHENRSLNRVYGFESEVKSKYDISTYECCLRLFQSLPLAHVINGKILILHGGLFSKDGVSLNDIKNIKRFRETPEQGIMCELLWSDPMNGYGRLPSKRGVGINFGIDVANKFLDDNGLDLLIRSHEVKNEGYDTLGRVVTVFSAPNYCDTMGNKAAIVQIKGDDLKPNFITFEAVPHPNVPSMAFAGSWMFT